MAGFLTGIRRVLLVSATSAKWLLPSALARAWPLAFASAFALALAGCSRRGPSASGAPEPATAAAPPDLVVYYGADVRGRYFATGVGAAARGGLARRASVLDQTRVEGGDLLLVDAGDAVPAITDAPDLDVGSSEAVRIRGRIVLTAFKRMGIEAMVPGERELALGPEALRALRADTKVAMVAANVGEAAPPPGEKPLFESTRLVEESAGRTVGIFGVVDLSDDAATPLRRAGFTIGDAVAAARAAAADLRARGATLLIALIHADAGPRRAEQVLASAGLATGASAADVLVVGHDDAGVAAAAAATLGPHAIARPAVVEAGALAETVGRLDVFWPRSRPDAGSGSATAEARLENRVIAVTPDRPEQFGVALLGRVLTTRIVDNGHLANETGYANAANAGSDAFENWDYGSSQGCALCHQHQDAQWRTTDHSHALATLKTAGHDRDPECLGCHMTGFLVPGGTRNLKTAYTYFADVGCEACHGPSVVHMRAPSNHQGTSRKVAMRVCFGCHTPDQSRGTFDSEAALKQVVGPGHGVPGSKPTG